SRALEKLRGIFRDRGVDLLAGTVLAAMKLAGSQTPPVGLAAGIAKASLGGLLSGSWPYVLARTRMLWIPSAAVIVATLAVLSRREEIPAIPEALANEDSTMPTEFLPATPLVEIRNEPSAAPEPVRPTPDQTSPPPIAVADKPTE